MPENASWPNLLVLHSLLVLAVSRCLIVVADILDSTVCGVATRATQKLSALRVVSTGFLHYRLAHVLACGLDGRSRVVGVSLLSGSLATGLPVVVGAGAGEAEARGRRKGCSVGRHGWKRCFRVLWACGVIVKNNCRSWSSICLPRPPKLEAGAPVTQVGRSWRCGGAPGLCCFGTIRASSTAIDFQAR